MQFLRMVKSELRRLFSDKKTLIIFFAVLAALIALVTLFLSSYAMNSLAEEISTEEMIAEYESRYKFFYSWYLYKIGEAPCPGNPDLPATMLGADDLKATCEYYKFLIDTHTTVYDYVSGLPAFDMGAELEEYRGCCSMLKIAQYSFYPLVFFSIVWAVLSCVYPYEKGVMKNYFASPADKGAIMGGKLAVLGLVNLSVWLIVVVWGLIFGCFGKPLYILDETANGYASISASAVFGTYMPGTLVAMLFISCVTVFIGQFIKKSLPSAMVGFGIVLLPLVLCTIIFDADIIELISFRCIEYRQYFPIIDLFGLSYNLGDYRIWVALAFHIIIAAVFVFVTLWLQMGREFHTRKRGAAKEELLCSF